MRLLFAVALLSATLAACHRDDPKAIAAQARDAVDILGSHSAAKTTPPSAPPGPLAAAPPPERTTPDVAQFASAASVADRPDYSSDKDEDFRWYILNKKGCSSLQDTLGVPVPTVLASQLMANSMFISMSGGGAEPHAVIQYEMDGTPQSILLLQGLIRCKYTYSEGVAKGILPPS